MATQTTTVRSAHGADYKIKTAELLAQMQAWLEDHDSLDGLLRINWASRHAAANNTSFTPIEIKVGDAWAELSVIFSREVLRLDVDAATSDGMQQQNDRKSKIFKQAVSTPPRTNPPSFVIAQYNAKMPSVNDRGVAPLFDPATGAQLLPDPIYASSLYQVSELIDEFVFDDIAARIARGTALAARIQEVCGKTGKTAKGQAADAKPMADAAAAILKEFGSAGPCGIIGDAALLNACAPLGLRTQFEAIIVIAANSKCCRMVSRTFGPNAQNGLAGQERLMPELRLTIRTNKTTGELIPIEILDQRAKVGNTYEPLKIKGAPITNANIHEAFTRGTAISGRMSYAVCFSSMGISVPQVPSFLIVTPAAPYVSRRAVDLNDFAELDTPAVETAINELSIDDFE